jgi:hypothetical protein
MSVISSILLSRLRRPFHVLERAEPKLLVTASRWALSAARSTIPAMDHRGWGWTQSEVRQAQLVEWLVPQSSSVTYVPVGPFYDALQDQGYSPFSWSTTSCMTSNSAL